MTQLEISALTPAGATGLDAVAAGGAAPLPDSVPGASLATSLTETQGLQLIYSLVIDDDEQWRSTTGAAVIGSQEQSASLTNNGLIESAGGAAGAEALGFGYLDAFVNSGAVNAFASGNASDLG